MGLGTLFPDRLRRKTVARHPATKQPFRGGIDAIFLAPTCVHGMQRLARHRNAVWRFVQVFGGYRFGFQELGQRVLFLISYLLVKILLRLF
jgi:hypothetical protein